MGCSYNVTYSAIRVHIFSIRKVTIALGYDPISNKVGEVIALRGTRINGEREIIL